mgnify:CR=1 FL=1
MSESHAPLSQLQRHLLSHLMERTDAGTHYFGAVPWRTSGSRSDQAAISRAMARLERRGLVLRINYPTGLPDGSGLMRTRADQPHNRTTHVRLTKAGIDTARRLTITTTRIDNRSTGVNGEEMGG